MRTRNGIGATLTAIAFICGSATAEENAIVWDMQSVFPGSLTQLGTQGKRMSDKLHALSGGTFQLAFREPGALVPALEAFDAVAAGSVQAAWGSPAFWGGKNTAFALFSSVPFGPDAGEYLAWMKFGGGKQLWDDIYHRYGVHGVLCNIVPPEASGWFRKEIKDLDDLKGLKMRFFGLGARVMEKLGVSTQLLAAGDIFPALERGVIDATEFSMPAIDLDLGFHQMAKHYYFPGWHQQTSLGELVINKNEWDGLSDTRKAQIETVCDAAVTHGLAEGEAIQIDALAELESKGVIIHVWPSEILDAMRAAWEEVVAEERVRNADFRKVWDSLAEFRGKYRRWRDLGYLR